MGDQERVTEFFEDRNDEIRERLFLEFNSLSVVYQRPSERFLKENIVKQAQASEKKHYSERWTKKTTGKSTVRIEDDEEDGAATKKDDGATKKEDGFKQVHQPVHTQ